MKNSVNDKWKMKVIRTIDKFEIYFIGTIYWDDLVKLRNKYIYKDICTFELSMDIEFLKEMKKIKNILYQNV